MGIEYVLLVIISALVLNFISTPLFNKEEPGKAGFIYYGASWAIGAGMGYIICNITGIANEFSLVLGLGIFGAKYIINELWENYSQGKINISDKLKKDQAEVDFFEIGAQRKTKDDLEFFTKTEKFGEKGPGL
ncbi:MAG: hypothetical protein ABIC19_01480 [Patescibacteria group bacterium]|nr:hypothetical protein [Patescibacteria group bacterium]